MCESHLANGCCRNSTSLETVCPGLTQVLAGHAVVHTSMFRQQLASTYLTVINVTGFIGRRIEDVAASVSTDWRAWRAPILNGHSECHRLPPLNDASHL